VPTKALQTFHAQDSSIMQLKCCLHSISNVVYMFVLHNCRSVVSCWSVEEQPTLVTVIKLNELHSLGMLKSLHVKLYYILCCYICVASIILPLGANLYITDASGSVYSISLNEAINDSNHQCNLLLCHHQSSLLEHLFVLRGRMNKKGFLTNIGSVSKITDEDNLSYSTSRSQICCDVLLGMGAGCQGLFKNNCDFSDQNLYCIVWVLERVI